tara:strand:+ start:78 stop:752 length:675 start_codon:yes stop_codon:yes gene_type:complete
MKVYLYCRNSCEHQKLSVEAQIDQLKAYAAKQDYDIAGVFVDEAVSGATQLAERTELQAALAILKKGDGLLCLNQSRLARNTSVYFAVAAQVAKQKAKLLFANGSEHSDDPMNKMVSGMMALIAELERATIKRRQKAAYAVMRKQGKTLGNAKLNKQRYGYTDNNGILEKNPSEQELIQLVVDMRNSGIKYKDIKSKVTKIGFMNRSNKEFSLSALYKLYQANV